MHKRYGFSEDDVDLMRSQKFLFILDGVDELAQKMSLHLICNDRYWTESIFIFTARSGFLQDSDVPQLLTPRHKVTAQINHAALSLIYLLPFNAQQLDEYTVKYAADSYMNEVDWSAEQYREARKKLPELKEFSSEPLHVFTSMQIMPRLHTPVAATSSSSDIAVGSISTQVVLGSTFKAVKKQRFDPEYLLMQDVQDNNAWYFPKFRRVELYALFCEVWFERELRRVLKLKVVPAPEVAADPESQAYHKKAMEMRKWRRNFCKKLAFQMFLHEKTMVNVSKDNKKATTPVFDDPTDLESMAEAHYQSLGLAPASPTQPVTDDWAQDLLFGDNFDAFESASNSQLSQKEKEERKKSFECNVNAVLSVFQLVVLSFLSCTNPFKNTLPLSTLPASWC